VSRRNPARAAQRIAQWVALGAVRWSCWNCRRPIGFVMPGRFFSCDACGAECTYAFTDVDTNAQVAHA
jgi:hypothetical protein